MTGIVSADQLQGHGALLPVGVFLLAGAAVFVVASRLARHADAVADATGVGRFWIGSILLAASTSLPELVTDIDAALADAIDIGIGDLFGSTLANTLLLALLDLGYRRRRLLHAVSTDHALVGSLAIVLTGTASAAIASGSWGSVGHVGIDTIAIVVLYLVGMRTVYYSSRPTAPPEQLRLGDTGRTILRRSLAGFAIAGLGLFILAPVVVASAHAIAIETGQSDTFVGTLLVGATTSLPEIAASVAAVRIGALDLAVGNILGSNAFNMCVLLGMDIAYFRGPVLQYAAADNLVAAQFAIVAVSLSTVSIMARGTGSRAGLRIESLLIVTAYVAAAWLLSAAGK